MEVMQWGPKQRQSGFTIVELLIVVVVIAILAAITIIAYNGIRDRSLDSAAASTLSQSVKKIQTYAVQNADAYPSSLSTIGITDEGETVYTYDVDNTVSPNYFCVSVKQGDRPAKFISSKNADAAPGTCGNLVGWWPFNGNTNDYAKDAHTSTNYGATATSGQNAKSGAYMFGVNNGIIVPNFDYGVLRPNAQGASWTLSAWVYSTSNSLSESIILGRQGCHGGLYAYSNKYAFAIKTNNCWTGSVTLLGPDTDTVWHHIAAVYTAGAMQLYADGSLIQSGTLTATMAGYNTNFHIGAFDTRVFNGKIDDARVYARALSLTEISDLYRAGAY
jgi:prepilin-type N-terminal cleavage/methylation domain-containing protein